MSKLTFATVTTLSLSTCMLSTASLAESSQPANSHYQFTVAGIYMTPTAGNLTYAVLTEPLPAPRPTWHQQNIDPTFHPGFDLGLAYVFSDQVNKVSLDWLYLTTKDKGFKSATGTESIAPEWYFGPGAQQLNGSSANGEAQFDVSDVRMLFHHLFQVSDRIQITPYGGAAFAYLKQSLTNKYEGTWTSILNVTTPYSITTFNTSKFAGAGPRLGVNMTGYITPHFGLLANMAADVLVGSMKTTTNFLSFGDGNTTPATTGLADQSITRMVPELDGKLGLFYDWVTADNTIVNLQLGYQFNVYINGINQVQPTRVVTNVFNAGVIAIDSSSQQQNNLGINGPYLRLTVTV